MDDLNEVYRRLDKVETEMEHLEQVWKSSVDDIKATIKSEIGDLKREQIADLKQAIKDRDQNMAAYEIRMRSVEDAVRDWGTGRNIIGYLVKILIGGGSLVVGYLGGRHLG